MKLPGILQYLCLSSINGGRGMYRLQMIGETGTRIDSPDVQIRQEPSRVLTTNQTAATRLETTTNTPRSPLNAPTNAPGSTSPEGTRMITPSTGTTIPPSRTTGSGLELPPIVPPPVIDKAGTPKPEAPKPEAPKPEAPKEGTAKTDVKPEATLNPTQKAKQEAAASEKNASEAKAASDKAQKDLADAKKASEKESAEAEKAKTKVDELERTAKKAQEKSSEATKKAEEAKEKAKDYFLKPDGTIARADSVDEKTGKYASIGPDGKARIDDIPKNPEQSRVSREFGEAYLKLPVEERADFLRQGQERAGQLRSDLDTIIKPNPADSMHMASLREKMSKIEGPLTPEAARDIKRSASWDIAKEIVSSKKTYEQFTPEEKEKAQKTQDYIFKGMASGSTMVEATGGARDAANKPLASVAPSPTPATKVEQKPDKAPPAPSVAPASAPIVPSPTPVSTKTVASAGTDKNIKSASVPTVTTETSKLVPNTKPSTSAPTGTPPVAPSANKSPQPSVTPTGTPSATPAFPTPERIKDRPNMVQSPYGRPGQLIDIAGHKAGKQLIDPYSGKPFIVPGDLAAPAPAPAPAEAPSGETYTDKNGKSFPGETYNTVIQSVPNLIRQTPETNSETTTYYGEFNGSSVSIDKDNDGKVIEIGIYKKNIGYVALDAKSEMGKKILAKYAKDLK